MKPGLHRQTLDPSRGLLITLSAMDCRHDTPVTSYVVKIVLWETR